LHGERDPVSWADVGAIGQSPFWLDNQSYGTISSDGRTITVADSGDGGGSPLLDTNDLAAVLPRGVPRSPLRINAVMADPAGQRFLLILASDIPNARYLTFLLTKRDAARSWREVDLGLDSLTLLPLDPARYVHLPKSYLVESGRWLALTTFEPRSAVNSRTHLVFVDLVNQSVVASFSADAVTPFQANDRSADGRWIAQLGDAMLYLVGPAAPGAPLPVLHLVPLERPCQAIAWVN
jgi:hypothetical protein